MSQTRKPKAYFILVNSIIQYNWEFIFFKKKIIIIIIRESLYDCFAPSPSFAFVPPPPVAVDSPPPCRLVPAVVRRLRPVAAHCSALSRRYLICRHPLFFSLIVPSATYSLRYARSTLKSSLSKSIEIFRVSFNCLFFCIFFDHALVGKFQFRMDLWIYVVEIDAKDRANVHSFFIMFKQQVFIELSAC